jgi:3-hydroxyisobutyrate dehydrogenase/glyoxylate/succinic semialdehyde reductase
MGSRMAANLQKNGYRLVLFNRTRSKAEALLGPCGTFSDSPAKLAEQVDVRFTMLAHPDAVEQAALGGNGFHIGHAPADHSNRRTDLSRYAAWEIHPVMKVDVQ